MALIEDIKGSIDVTNSGYHRVFATNMLKPDISHDLAQLMSKIQGAVISNGSILEKILIDPRFNRNPIILKAKVDDILKKTNGHYPKVRFGVDVLKTKGFILKGKKAIEVDYIVIKDNDIYVYEIKDGDSFDTKKSEAEYQSLMMITEFLSSYSIFNKITPGIILWNSNDISKASFKSIKGKSIILRGKDFCDKFDIDYDSLNASRTYNNLKNVNYVLSVTDSIRTRFLSQKTQIEHLNKLQISKDKLLLLNKKENAKRIQNHIDRKVKSGESLLPVIKDTELFVREAETRNAIKKLAKTNEEANKILKRMRSTDKNERTLGMSNAISYIRTKGT
ncbi:endonuclease HhaII [Paramecium bursaria Chlorella virus CVB-1]|nr:endonuclease HhaII [Paramecium bursaria Chlorella virus CVB-1]